MLRYAFLAPPALRKMPKKITAALMIWTGEIVSPMKTTAPKMARAGEPLRNAPVAPAPMKSGQVNHE